MEVFLLWIMKSVYLLLVAGTLMYGTLACIALTGVIRGFNEDRSNSGVVLARMVFNMAVLWVLAYTTQQAIIAFNL